MAFDRLYGKKNKKIIGLYIEAEIPPAIQR
jgi:hypothetical protein